MIKKPLKKIKYFERYYESLPQPKNPLTLDRIKNLLALFNNPQKKLRGIHIGGTNGKGSVSAICQSVLTKSGYKVGLYTSPHLVSTCERIRINYKNISKKKLVHYLKKIKNATEILTKLKEELPTWFEVLTASAILYFIDEKIDIAIIEVGLGGRGDATNILNLDIAVLTNIQMDHKHILGNTPTKICKNKIEIIKNNYYVVTGCSKKLINIIKTKCKKENAKLFILEKDIKTNFEKNDEKYTYFNLKVYPFKKYIDLKINILGQHQIKNAALAITACQLLSKKLFKKQISEKTIKKGLKSILWPGRFQIISQNPKIIIDGGHNPAGIKTIIKTFQNIYPKQKAIILFAAKNTKDVKSMIKIIKPITGQMILVSIPKLDVLFKARKLKKYYPMAKILSLKDAIKFSTTKAKIKKEPILICGSLYFLGEIIRYLKLDIAKT